MVDSVCELWRYPAKSMLGERLSEMRVTTTGVVGDRMWAVRDMERGGIRGAKKIPALMRCAAAFMEEPDGSLPPPHIEITLPDGSKTTSASTDADLLLSAALGRSVGLAALRAAEDGDHFRRGAPDHDDLLTELREVFGREEDEPLPDLSGMPLEIFEYESPPGTYVDVYPIHLITTSSLATLARLAPDSQVAVERFRPNLVIDTGVAPADGWLEQSWIGQRVDIGEVQIEVVMACPRCVMPTLAVGDLPADREPLRKIIRDANQYFGVYARVARPGVIRRGDAVLVGPA